MNEIEALAVSPRSYEHLKKIKYENREKDKEITRLNNIINELEKYIGAEWYSFDNESVEFAVAKDILDKLKELKAGGKEWMK